MKNKPAGAGSGNAGLAAGWLSRTAARYCGEFCEFESETRTRAYCGPAGRLATVEFGVSVRVPG